MINKKCLNQVKLDIKFEKFILNLNYIFEVIFCFFFLIPVALYSSLCFKYSVLHSS